MIREDFNHGNQNKEDLVINQTKKVSCLLPPFFQCFRGKGKGSKTVISFDHSLLHYAFFFFGRGKKKHLAPSSTMTAKVMVSQAMLVA